jgi:hypothetical protein
MSRWWDDGERFARARIIAAYNDEYDTVLDALEAMHRREGWT